MASSSFPRLARLLRNTESAARSGLPVILAGALGGCSSVLGLDDFTDAATDGTTSATGSTATVTGAGSGNSSSTTEGSGAGSPASSGNSTGAGGAADGGGGSHEGGGGSGGSGGGTGGSEAIACAPSSNTNATGNCDVLDPATCPDGTHCAYANDFGTLDCVPDSAGVGQLGEHCDAEIACAGPLECIGGFCSTYCCPGSNDPCSQIEGGYCIRELRPDNDQTIFVMACQFHDVCTLLEDDCEDPDDVCVMFNPELGLSACAPSVQQVPEGEPCQYLNQCGESGLCTVNGCRQLCDLADWMTSEVPTGGCPVGRQCVDFGGWGDPGGLWDHIGVCLPPT